MIKRILKTAACGYIMLSYLTFAFIGRALIWDKYKRRDFYLKYVAKSCKALITAMGIEAKVTGLENIKPNTHYLIIANHLSYLDPLVMSTIKQMCFVTSVEMRETPGLGIITELGGCIYVERRSRENIKNEISSISDSLKKGYSVVVYPEATSSNGSSVLPFKKSLFNAAVESGAAVLPMVIQYENVDNIPISANNHDWVCWYGTMDFAPHFNRLMKFNKIKMQVTILPEISSTGKTREDLANESYQKISTLFKPFT